MTLLAASSSGGMGQYGIMIWVVILIVFIVIFMVRPQRKEASRKEQMMKGLDIGDTVLTTSGFYGTVIGIQDDVVIVEFGNNKNCRIPMTRSAISQIEKPQDAVSTGNDEPEEPPKRGLFGR